MRQLTVPSKVIDVVYFLGRPYTITHTTSRVALTALRRGVLDHLGSCPEIPHTRMSTPQMYRVNGFELLAGAVSSEAQFVDNAWLMRPAI